MCEYLICPPFCAMHAVILWRMLLTSCCMNGAGILAHSACKAHWQNALPHGVGMAKVKATFIRKQNQISISTSEVQVTAAPIPPCCSITSVEKLADTDTGYGYVPHKALIQNNFIEFLQERILYCG